jgi:hypothetical protein
MKTSLLFIISTMISETFCFPKRFKEKVETIEQIDWNLFKRFHETQVETGTVHQETIIQSF